MADLTPKWVSAGVDYAATALILIRLWVRIPCPAQIRAPSVFSMRVRSEP